MRFLKLILFIVLFGVFSNSNMFSQKLDSIIGLNEVTITGARFKHFNTGHFYTVIDSSTKAIQASSYLGDLLTNSSLFQINSYGAGSVSVSARGMGEKRTPVVWNGFNIQSILSTGTDLGELPSFFFEDVRAQMGGSSALFGSGAAGGVLFLNNKQKFNDIIDGQIITQFGSFGNYFQGGEFSFSNRNYSGSIKAYYNTAKNDFNYRAKYSGVDLDTSQLNANSKQYGFMMNNFLKISTNQLLNVNFWITHTDKNIAPTLSDVASNSIADGNQVDNFFATSAEYNNQLTKSINVFARSGLFHTKLDYVKPSWMQESNSKASWWVNEVEGSVNFLNYFKVNTGLNVTYEHAKSSSFIETKTRYREAIFASVKFYHPEMHVSVSANGRSEIVAGDAIPFTYSFGIEYNPIEPVKIKGNIAKNYRLPSFNDLYYKDAYSEGNPDLKPENGMNYEVGLEFLQKAESSVLRIGANLFLSRMDNWINWAPRPDYIWSVFNIDKAEISGLESFIETKFVSKNSELSATVMYTYTDAKDKNSRKYISNVPKDKFTYNMKFRFVRTSLTYQATQVGERFGDATNTKTIAAYNISNVILSQTIPYMHSSVSFDIGFYNVFDKDYMVMDGYPMPKRNIRAGLRILF